MNDWAIKPSQWLAPPHSGMGYCWHCACSPGCTLTHYAYLKTDLFSHYGGGSTPEQ